MNTNQSISHHRPLPHLPPQAYVSPLARNSPRSYFQRSRLPVPARVNSGAMNRNRFGLRKYAEQTLGNGSLRKCVTVPEGEDLDEWLAVHVVDFYTQINLLYGSITEFCSPTTCPEMKASDEFEYLWQDHKKYKNPTKMPAPEYIEHMMSWATELINNEQLFPSRIGVKFPKNFQSTVRQLVKRLFRVYAHMYCHHYPVLVALGLDSHMNTSFKHYVLFSREFNLESGEGFYGPLAEMVERILKSG